MFICAKHRVSLGQYWSKPNVCKYPDHKGVQRATKTDRSFNLAIVQDVWKVFGILVPVAARKYLFFNVDSNIGNYYQACESNH